MVCEKEHWSIHIIIREANHIKKEKKIIITCTVEPDTLPTKVGGYLDRLKPDKTKEREIGASLLFSFFWLFYIKRFSFGPTCANSMNLIR